MVSIYPNPSNEYFVIEFEGLPKGEWDLLVINVTGEVVMRKRSIKSYENIVVSKQNIGKGMFFAYLKSSDKMLFLSKQLLE